MGWLPEFHITSHKFHSQIQKSQIITRALINRNWVTTLRIYCRMKLQPSTAAMRWEPGFVFGYSRMLYTCIQQRTIFSANAWKAKKMPSRGATGLVNFNFGWISVVVKHRHAVMILRCRSFAHAIWSKPKWGRFSTRRKSLIEVPSTFV